jgi:hypothetical protein
LLLDGPPCSWHVLSAYPRLFSGGQLPTPRWRRLTILTQCFGMSSSVPKNKKDGVLSRVSASMSDLEISHWLSQPRIPAGQVSRRMRSATRHNEKHQRTSRTECYGPKGKSGTRSDATGSFQPYRTQSRTKTTKVASCGQSAANLLILARFRIWDVPACSQRSV